jgi:hypothetical protein
MIVTMVMTIVTMATMMVGDDCYNGDDDGDNDCYNCNDDGDDDCYNGVDGCRSPCILL